MKYESVGLIGIGLLGFALAKRLLAHGFEVHGYDTLAERRAEFERAGGSLESDGPAVAQAARRVILSLPNANISRDVVQELLGDLQPDAIVIDTTTGAPDEMVSIGATVRSAGFEYLDASIGGSSKQAEEGQVIVIAGGSPIAFRRCEDLFSTFASRSFQIGECGSGAKMKLVTNLVLGLTRAILAEGLQFAKGLDLDLSQVLEVLKAGPAYSRPMDTKGTKMLNGDFSPEARLSQHLKDVRLILDAATNSTAVPFSQLHRTLLEFAESRGHGGLDNSAILKAFDDLPASVSVNLELD